MAKGKVTHPKVVAREAAGLEARKQAPLSSHEGWKPAKDRPDPVDLLDEQNKSREADLLPVRHGRMSVSPFTFYRGAARIMAADLQATPTAGLEVQLCGDAHLSNFGLFASPERVLLFDLNDFDETLPGPFEYDVKRMAASFTIAARNNGFTPQDERAITMASVRSYRRAMKEFAAMRTLDVWYSRMSEDELMEGVRRASGRRRRELQDGYESREGRGEEGREDAPQGAHQGQPARAVQAGRSGRRAVSDRQSAADRRAGP